MVPIPEKVAYAALETDAWEHIRCAEVVVDRPHPIVSQHCFSELVQTLTSREPPGRYDHGQVARIEFLGLFDEQLVDRSGACSVSAVAQLVRRVPDDDVELHVVSEQLADANSDVVCVNKRVGVSFEIVASRVVVFASSAICTSAVGVNGDLLAGQGVGTELALASAPGVFGALEPDLAVLGREGLGNRVRTVGELRAVDASACQERRKLRDAYPEDLLREDVIDALGQVGNLQDQSVSEAAHDLAEEHSWFGEGVEKGDSGISPDV